VRLVGYFRDEIEDATARVKAEGTEQESNRRRIGPMEETGHDIQEIAGALDRIGATRHRVPFSGNSNCNATTTVGPSEKDLKPRPSPEQIGTTSGSLREGSVVAREEDRRGVPARLTRILYRVTRKRMTVASLLLAWTWPPFTDPGPKEKSTVL
jgi:hypothetical protein